jgi:hypothetical protein
MTEQEQQHMESGAAEAVANTRTPITSILKTTTIRMLQAAPCNITVRSLVTSESRLIIPDELKNCENIIEWLEDNFKVLEGPKTITVEITTAYRRTATGRCEFSVTETAREVCILTLHEIMELAEDCDDFESLILAIEGKIEDRADPGYEDDGGYNYSNYVVNDTDDQDTGRPSRETENRKISDLILEHYPEQAERLDL